MIIIAKVLTWMLMDYVTARFHKCNYKSTNAIETEKGSIWYESCDCGKDRKVLFNSDSECVGIIND